VIKNLLSITLEGFAVLFGAHVSITKSIDLCFDRARDIGANTFQIFSRSRLQWRAPPLSPEKVKVFREKHETFGIDPLVIHMPYLPNPSSPEAIGHKRAIEQLTIEMERAHLLGVQYVVTHLGSHKGSGIPNGIDNVCKVLTAVFEHTKTIDDVMILLENTAGSPKTVGGKFEDIQTILNRFEKNEDKLGVCFDTCHAYAAGYDISNSKGVKQTLDSFDELIGLDRMKVIHVNDSKGQLGSHRDLHEHIGLGNIGLDGFQALLNDQRIKQLPFVLETPKDDVRDDKTNLKVLRDLVG
jgi:deoxyribonuclease-4